MQQGLTLIELTTCVALCVLLASLALPSMRELLQQHRAISAEHTLISHLQLARWTAVTHNTESILCPSVDGTSCARDGNWSSTWLLFTDIDGNRKADTPDSIIRATSPPNPQRLRLVSSRGRSFIRYFPDGRSAGTNLTISICSMEGALLAQVVVNNAGRPRGQRPKSSRPCPF
ncbi:GspH/FimT family pseudopilin [Stenotrophomonas pigmentata]|uniref:GspH/FimT family pseudopilin n=1 Tax=Stenotrophomonas pigmentata TaxID=3055080 RepID=UPI0026F0FD58|nr:GspH/FimT family pseudopilin [Stenotrophomonas sp. 610A2]